MVRLAQNRNLYDMYLVALVFDLTRGANKQGKIEKFIFNKRLKKLNFRIQKFLHDFKARVQSFYLKWATKMNLKNNWKFDLTLNADFLSIVLHRPGFPITIYKFLDLDFNFSYDLFLITWTYTGVGITSFYYK